MFNAFVGYSCEKREVNASEILLNKIEHRSESNSIIGHIIPSGSNTYYDNTGRLIIELPSGYEYIGLDEQGLTIGGGTVGVSCNCTTGSGCTANKVTDSNGKVTYTCIIQENCSVCTKSETLISAGGSELSIEVVGLVNYNLGATFITDLDQYTLDTLNDNTNNINQSFVNISSIHGNVFEEIFELLEFEIFSNSISNWFPENPDPSIIYKKYYFNIFGNLCVTTMPEGFEIQVNDIVITPTQYLSTGGGTEVNDVTCSCNSEGGGTCKYTKKKIPFGSTYEFCSPEGECTGCDLKD